ncbi:MAG: class I SAM-dependent methyltransferase [Flavobacteriaceae bacterium]|nr:class I SAM-dependent methyltransferase [Flavobacteriaceae bacterium]
MISVKESYKSWSKIYDSNKNKTRDLDLIVSKKILSDLVFDTVLEIGCGTGKNTNWLCKKSKNVIAVDFSPEMLEIAKNKIRYSNVNFIEADITKNWGFVEQKVDLITINLVLEHIKNIHGIFKSANTKLNTGGFLFISELHPYKQFLGSQAKFNNELVQSYTHQISAYFKLATENNFTCLKLIESFDEDPKKNEKSIPRLISFLFVKN